MTDLPPTSESHQPKVRDLAGRLGITRPTLQAWIKRRKLNQIRHEIHLKRVAYERGLEQAHEQANRNLAVMARHFTAMTVVAASIVVLVVINEPRPALQKPVAQSLAIQSTSIPPLECLAVGGVPRMMSGMNLCWPMHRLPVGAPVEVAPNRECLYGLTCRTVLSQVAGHLFFATPISRRATDG